MPMRKRTPRQKFKLRADEEPTEAQIKAAKPLKLAATKPPDGDARPAQASARSAAAVEQIVDGSAGTRCCDQTGYSAEAKERAASLVKSFEEFLSTHRDEVEGASVLLCPAAQGRLRYRDIKALADAIQSPPRSWTPRRYGARTRRWKSPRCAVHRQTDC